MIFISFKINGTLTNKQKCKRGCTSLSTLINVHRMASERGHVKTFLCLLLHPYKTTQLVDWNATFFYSKLRRLPRKEKKKQWWVSREGQERVSHLYVHKIYWWKDMAVMCGSGEEIENSLRLKNFPFGWYAFANFSEIIGQNPNPVLDVNESWMPVLGLGDMLTVRIRGGKRTKEIIWK